jgi:hypothetical protein
MMLFQFKNKTEVIFSYMSNSFKDWLFSRLYTNDGRMLYLSLTLFGLSVTIQKKKKL